MGLSTFETFKRLHAGDDLIRIEGDNLRQLQECLLGIMRDISDTCERYNIPYTLSGGSCLGAIRHNGFIPWDDDIDLNMMRSDYLDFKEHFLADFGDKYWVHDPMSTKNYGLGFARVRKKGTVLKNHDDYHNDECGICVDIFLMENVPDNALLRSMHCFGSLARGFALSCRRFYDAREEYRALSKDDPEVAKTFEKKIRLGKLFSFKTVDEWTKSWDRWNGCCENNSSKYISIPSGRKHYNGELYLRADFFPAAMHEFEGLQLRIPCNPRPYMLALYGEDYMQVPPLENRETHVVYELDFGD